jgi:hypothetical protein
VNPCFFKQIAERGILEPSRIELKRGRRFGRREEKGLRKTGK